MSVSDSETLEDVVSEYLYWRKVNPHIKGGENYLRRLQSTKAALAAISPQPAKIYSESEILGMFRKGKEMVQPIIDAEAKGADITGDLLNTRLGKPNATTQHRQQANDLIRELTGALNYAIRHSDPESMDREFLKITVKEANAYLNNEGGCVTIAALYVEKGGGYWNLPNVDPWDEPRDARNYAGPHPVVAHPPCQRWGKMWFGQPLHVKKTGERKIKGDDGGCFAAALRAVRTYGGVLEHPWGSHAWAHFRLNMPSRKGGWVQVDEFGGYTCCVEQGRYGHYARKPTLLYVCGVENLSELRWGHSEAKYDPAVVERMGLKRAKRLGEVGAKGGGKDSSQRIGTPVEFRDLLISIALSSNINGGKNE